MKIAVLDIETTGFLNQKGNIVEIGIVELDLSTGETKLLFDSLLKEPTLSAKDRNAWIFNNSSLKVEDIRNAPVSGGVLTVVQDIINNYKCVAWNSKFDFDFLESRGIKINKLPCPMLLSTDYFQLPHKNGGYGNKWPSVEEAWARLFPDKPYVEEHRGADDAIHEAQIIYELYKLNVFKIDTNE